MWWCKLQIAHLSGYSWSLPGLPRSHRLLGMPWLAIGACLLRHSHIFQQNTQTLRNLRCGNVLSGVPWLQVDLTSNEGAAGGAPRGGTFTGANLELDASRYDELLVSFLQRPSSSIAGDGGGREVEEEDRKAVAQGGGAEGGTQKLALVEGLLEVGHWEAAKLLMRALEVGGWRLGGRAA